MINTRKYNLIINIASIVIGILIVCLGVFTYEDFIQFICITLGIGMILVNSVLLAFYLRLVEADKIYIYDMVCAGVNIVLGALFIWNHGLAMSIVFGAILIIFPIIRILISVDKKNQLKKEIPYFILGLLMFFNVADVVFRIAIIVAGSILIVLGIVNIILSFCVVKKEQNDSNTIDVEYKEL